MGSLDNTPRTDEEAMRSALADSAGGRPVYALKSVLLKTDDLDSDEQAPERSKQMAFFSIRVKRARKPLFYTFVRVAATGCAAALVWMLLLLVLRQKGLWRKKLLGKNSPPKPVLTREEREQVGCCFCC